MKKVHTLLQTEDLAVGYGTKTLLKNLNLEIKTGDFVALVGPNGTGKSTLLHTLTGLLKAQSGKIYLDGKSTNFEDIQSLSKQISIVLSSKIGQLNLQVKEVVALGRIPHTAWHGKLSSFDQEVVEKTLKLVGITHFANRNFDELSDGEKQRVMIAKALAQDTPLIILDEPTAHLDLPNRINLLILLKDLAKTTHKAILLSTHELEIAIQLANQLWLIQDQKLIAQSPEDLVLSGTIQDTFSGKWVTFDMLSGAFKAQQTTDKTIHLEGPEMAVLWTARALQKLGYKQDSEASIRIEISPTLPREWKIVTPENTQSFTSIGSLQKALLND